MANARVPVTLLDGVTGTGAGSPVDLGDLFDDFSYVAGSTTGGAGSSTAKIEGSHDGSHWFSIVSPEVSGGGLVSGRAPSANSGASLVPYVRYIRGNCTAHIGGGAAVTLTVVPA